MLKAPPVATTLNRAQRRAAARQKAQRPAPDYRAQWRVLSACRPYEPDEIAGEIVDVRLAWERLRTGRGTEPDFDLVAIMLNAILVRAEQIDQSLVDTVIAGQRAMVRMQDRRKRGLPLGVDGPGLVEIPDALDVYEAVTMASSPAQMVSAIRETYRRIRGGEVLTLGAA